MVERWEETVKRKEKRKESKRKRTKRQDSGS